MILHESLNSNQSHIKRKGRYSMCVQVKFYYDFSNDQKRVLLLKSYLITWQLDKLISVFYALKLIQPIENLTILTVKSSKPKIIKPCFDLKIAKRKIIFVACSHKAILTLWLYDYSLRSYCSDTVTRMVAGLNKTRILQASAQKVTCYNKSIA